ncbi:MAG: ATP-binding cassette domain-containing protein [Kiritimatiellae bacterium]|nr:ATP-binding cassette domain-containing protein [Kiritimatiellia bacterium]
MLEALNISFEYGARSVISDVSLVARPGEVVAVAGANGAGKTTLLRILAGLAHPSAGTVRANRSDIFLE